MTQSGDDPRFQLERAVLDAREMTLIIRRMAGELIERHKDAEGLLLLGIRTRGLPLAERLADELERMEGYRPPIGALDITLYRDDLSTIASRPVVKETLIPDSTVDGRTVVLCDDVLFTGRTVRAALDELNDFGRPRAVWLAVLVDRGHRELPIQADVVGKRLSTSRNELVEVGFVTTDGQDYVHLLRRTEGDRG